MSGCDFNQLKNEYGSKVLIDGWYDDRVLEEEIVKDFLAKRDNGQLMIQRMGSLLKLMSQPITPSTSGDGFVRFGDHLQLINPGANPNMVRLQRVKDRVPSVLSIDAADEMLYFRNELPDPSSCTASFKLAPTSRNVFEVLSPEGKKKGVKVTYGEPIVLKVCPLLCPSMFVSSDNCGFANMTKKSKHQEISCIGTLCFLCHFVIEHIDPRRRIQNEGCPIMVGTRFVLKHCKSNQALAVEYKYFEKTFFGYEQEASAFTFLDEHRVEKDYNEWIFNGKSLIGGNTDLFEKTVCYAEEEPNKV